MLQSRLITVMRRELDSQGLQLSEYGSQSIEQMVGYGVQRMRVEKASEHAGHVMQAERNLKFLVKHFSDYSRTTGTFPKLSDSKFDAALMNCRTIWPYWSAC